MESLEKDPTRPPASVEAVSTRLDAVSRELQIGPRVRSRG